MRNIILTGIVVSAAVAAGPAAAQSAAPFTGPHVEAILGYDDLGNDDGIVYGLAAGYDAQMGGLVVGVDGEVTENSTDGCVGSVVLPGDALCTTADRDLYVGGRVGAVLADNVLLYARAGYSNARVSIDYDDGDMGAGNYSVGTNLDGIRAGGGLELALGPNAFARAEYRYSNYQDGYDRHQVVGGLGMRF